MEKYTFNKPYEFEGKTYNFVEFDLTTLKGSDISQAKKLFVAGGNYSPLPATDPDFCALILARITKQPVEFFTEMPARDYCALTQRVSNFLLA